MRIVDCDDLEFENTGMKTKHGRGYAWKITDCGVKTEPAVLVLISDDANRSFCYGETRTYLENQKGQDVFLVDFVHCFATRIRKKPRNFDAKTNAWTDRTIQVFWNSARPARNLAKELDRCG